jgi:hypothetical protein
MSEKLVLFGHTPLLDWRGGKRTHNFIVNSPSLSLSLSLSLI